MFYNFLNISKPDKVWFEQLSYEKKCFNFFFSSPTCMWHSDGNFYAFEGCNEQAGMFKLSFLVGHNLFYILIILCLFLFNF